MTIIFAQTIVHELDNSSFVFYSTICNVNVECAVWCFISVALWFYFSSSVIFFCCYCWYFTFSLPLMPDARYPNAISFSIYILILPVSFLSFFFIGSFDSFICMLNVELSMFVDPFILFAFVPAGQCIQMQKRRETFEWISFCHRINY